MLFVDNFKKKKYPIPDMASILKATSTVGARALKPSSGGAKHVGSKLECLSKESIERRGEEERQRVDKCLERVDKKKKKVEEPQKKKETIP